MEEKQKLFEHFEEDAEWVLTHREFSDFFRLLTTIPSTPRVLQILGEKNLSQEEIFETLINYCPKILSRKIWDEISFHLIFSRVKLEFFLKKELWAIKNIQNVLEMYSEKLSEDFLQKFEGFLFSPYFALKYLLESLVEITRDEKLINFLDFHFISANSSDDLDDEDLD